MMAFFDSVVEFMLSSTESEDPKIAQDACDFWQVVSQYDYICRNFLYKYLPRILTSLLNR